MMNYVQLALQVLIVCLLLFAGLRIRSTVSQRRNEITIAHWINGMDIVRNNQRWRGSRSEIMEVIDMQKQATGMDMKLLCVTRSGRWFLLSVQSRWCLVNSWKLETIDIDSAALKIGATVERMLSEWKLVEWNKKSVT